MGTSIGAVIDYLVAGLPAPLNVVEPGVEVADNWPTTDGGTWVIIGRTAVDQASAGQADNAYVELGTRRIEETYTLPGIVQVIRPGPGQKPARDCAIRLFDAVVKYVSADPTLGGVLTRGRVGIVSRMSLTQTQDEEDTGGAGLLLAAIHFELAIQNTYIP